MSALSTPSTMQPAVRPGDRIQVSANFLRQRETLLEVEVLAVVTVAGIPRPIVEFAMESARGVHPVRRHRLLWSVGTYMLNGAGWGSTAYTDEPLDEYLASWETHHDVTVERRVAAADAGGDVGRTTE